MKKKKSMRKKVEESEQLDLIDVRPKDAKLIIEAARFYKKLQAVRLSALVKEVAQKHRVLELVKAAHLQPLEGGKIKFSYDGVKVSVEHREELIKIVEKKNPEE